MYIALCDDDRYMIEKLKSLILEYSKKNRISVTIDSYSDGNSLIDANVNYDFIILDYMMEGKDGLQTARELRKRKLTSAIVFLTSYSSFVMDAFEVNAFRFLLKPIDKTNLYKVLDDYISSTSSNYPITIVQNGELKKIDASDIYYVEADGKYSIIHMKDEIIHSSKTLSGVAELLPEYCFVKTHRSYVVNLNFVKSYSSDTINFMNDETAYISKTYQRAFKNNLKDFLVRSNVFFDFEYIQ